MGFLGLPAKNMIIFKKIANFRIFRFTKTITRHRIWHILPGVVCLKQMHATRARTRTMIGQTIMWHLPFTTDPFFRDRLFLVFPEFIQGVRDGLEMGL